MKNKFFLVLFLWGGVLFSVSYGYAGNIWVKEDIGASTIYFLENNNPASGGSLKSSNAADLVLGTHYFRTTGLTPPDFTSIGWTRYSFQDSRYDVIYLLLINGSGQYSIVRPFRLQGTTRPPGSLTSLGGINLYVDSAGTWYTAGTPNPASIIFTFEAIVPSTGNGLFSSNLPAAPSGYQTTGTKYQTRLQAEGWPAAWPSGRLNNSIIYGSNTKESQVRMVYTSYFGDSSTPAVSPFIRVPSFRGDSAVTATITLRPGLNFFSLGIPSSESGLWYRISGTSSASFSTIGEFVNDILGGTANVSTFGYIDNLGNVVGVEESGGSFRGPTGFLAQKMSATQGYQVYLKTSSRTITIRNSE